MRQPAILEDFATEGDYGVHLMPALIEQVKEKLGGIQAYRFWSSLAYYDLDFTNLLRLLHPIAALASLS